MADFIPQRDESFDIFQDNFIRGAEPNLEKWGIPQSDCNMLKLLQSDWSNAWSKAKNKDTRTHTDVRAKGDARKKYQKSIRQFVKQWVAYNSKVADAEREGLGLKTRVNELTPSSVPDHAPKVAIDGIRHLVHHLRLTDPANPRTKSKPKGVRVMQVFRYIGSQPPPVISQYQYIGNATRFVFKSIFSEEEVGKIAYYRARYENSRGQTGPLSEYISAAIA